MTVTGQEQETGPDGGDDNPTRTIIIGLGVLFVLVGTVVSLVLWPTFQSPDEVRACRSFVPVQTITDCSLDGTTMQTGTITDIDGQVITMAGDTGSTMTFAVREADTDVIDMDHLADHAASDHPVDIYFIDNDTNTVVFITDTPESDHAA